MKTTRLNKKAEMHNSVANITYLVTGLAVAVLVLIFVGALGGNAYQIVEDDVEQIAQVTTDTQFTPLVNVSVSLGHKSIVNGTLTIENNTNKTYGLHMFTIDYDLGTISILTNASLNNTEMNASYTYGNPDIEDAIKEGIISGFTAVETTGNYTPLIALAVIVTIVLSMLIVFPKGNHGNSGAL